MSSENSQGTGKTMTQDQAKAKIDNFIEATTKFEAYTILLRSKILL